MIDDGGNAFAVCLLQANLVAFGDALPRNKVFNGPRTCVKVIGGR